LELAPQGLVVVRNLPNAGRRRVRRLTRAIEPDLVYPLLRGRDVQRWQAAHSHYIILPQDPEKRTGYPKQEMRERWPDIYAWFVRFRQQLQQRRDRCIRRIIDAGGPFYSMCGVGPYTLAPWKVVWHEVADTLIAAVAGPLDDPILGRRPQIPDHTLLLVDCRSPEEARYLCAVLNSVPVRAACACYIAGHPDPHILDNIGIPAFNATNPVHRQLAHASMRAHRLKADGDTQDEVRLVEHQIDALAAKLWLRFTQF